MDDVWELLEESLIPIGAAFRDAGKDIPPHPIQEIEGWAYMRWMMVVDEPTNGKRITETAQGRAYISPDAMDAAFERFVEHGYATKSGDLYTLTDAGREAFLGYFAGRENAYDGVEILSDADFEVYINFMKKGYEAGKTADKPEHAPSSDYGYKFYTGITGGQLGPMLGWINLFELYRDDVHVAAWKAAGFTGIEIETLSTVWAGHANDAATLAQRLAHRGYTQADYQTTLDALAELGYLHQSDKVYILTDEGKAVRDKIEADTNAVYNEWVAKTFSDEEIAEFARVVDVLKQG